VAVSVGVDPLLKLVSVDFLDPVAVEAQLARNKLVVANNKDACFLECLKILAVLYIFVTPRKRVRHN